jgi:hypothetical protein
MRSAVALRVGAGRNVGGHWWEGFGYDVKSLACGFALRRNIGLNVTPIQSS